jgi:broad specificity phosphatase PhoE
MCYVAALYLNGKVVTGHNHGDAFNKLSPDDQEKDLQSGFLDPRTGKFILEDNSQFYLKRILLIRHAQPSDEFPDPGISEIGHMQCKRVANFIMARFNLSQFKVFSSPVRRCRETMESIFENIRIEKCIDPCYLSRVENESTVDFVKRIQHVLEILPERSIIVTHCDFIVNISQISLTSSDPALFCQIHCEDCRWGCRISCGSVTYLKHNRPIFVGVTDFQE